MAQLTPEQKIKREILLWGKDDRSFDRLMTGEAIDKAYDDLAEKGGHYDPMYDLREGDVATDVPCEYLRHHESKSVAMKCCDGSWVGWTYWYGGGKHAEPESIDWMDKAYDLDCTEEEKVVVVRTFKKSKGVADVA